MMSTAIDKVTKVFFQIYVKNYHYLVIINLFQTVQKIDEDVKAKAYTFSDIKQSLQNAKKAKSSGSTLATAELVEVLTPEVVRGWLSYYCTYSYYFQVI